MDIWKEPHIKQLIEFVGLLKDQNRKEINEWKRENHFVHKIAWRKYKVDNDADVVYAIYRQVFEEEDLLKFVKYVHQDYSESDVEWISHKKKNEFLQWITSKIIMQKEIKPKEFLEIKMNQKLTDEEYQAILEAQRSIIEE